MPDILSFIKRLLPARVKASLKMQSTKLYAMKMRRLHRARLARLKGARIVRVVFLAIHESVWKVDPVFSKMLADPSFDPVILVCPYTSYGEERMLEEMDRTFQYFAGKGYPVVASYDRTHNRWLRLEELGPDVVFFTNPHSLTRPEYYERAYSGYLSCYVPYFYLITVHGRGSFRQSFHNAMWKVFMPHQHAMDEARKAMANGDKNCLLTGYPACEPFYRGKETLSSRWKAQPRPRKRVIFAPHHTIDERGNPHLSNFLRMAQFMVDLSNRTRDQVQWSFKPHPMLKPKLYLHLAWGREKTDAYYEYWRVSANTQLDDGEYEDLFIDSDAIIHDSGSFIVEYLFLKKPCLYLVRDDAQLDEINSYGRKALTAYRIARAEEDIERFVAALVDGTLPLKEEHLEFFKEEIEPLYADALPSDQIIGTIKEHIAHGAE